ncbi:unnamed protein product, partial [Ceratitis capitata]
QESHENHLISTHPSPLTAYTQSHLASQPQDNACNKYSKRVCKQRTKDTCPVEICTGTRPATEANNNNR